MKTLRSSRFLKASTPVTQQNRNGPFIPASMQDFLTGLASNGTGIENDTYMQMVS